MLPRIKKYLSALTQGFQEFGHAKKIIYDMAKEEILQMTDDKRRLWCQTLSHKEEDAELSHSGVGQLNALNGTKHKQANQDLTASQR